ncbi:hypothetical protein FKM82_028913 [Ascaphus truei]
MRSRGVSLGTISLSPTAASNPTKIPVPISLPGKRFSVSTLAFLDSGAGDNFIDQSLAETHKIPLVSKKNPIALEAIDGRPLQPAFI